jgi:pimeloyl-ACP methyl ester carboxylesterase
MLHERRVEISTVAITYAEGPPNGPPLVILHGGAGSWSYGADLIDALLGQWHIFAPDFRGHGGSGHVPGRYRLRDYVSDTSEFLEQVVAAPAVIYGHSLGGEVAIMVAATRPDLVRAVIDGDASLSIVDHPTEEPTHRAMNTLWHSLAGRPVAEIAVALRATPVPGPGGGPPLTAGEVFGPDAPWFAFQAQNLHQLDPDMLAAVLTGPAVMLEGYDPAQLLPKITCPVLMLQGDPAAGGLLCDDDVALGLRLLAQGRHVQLTGMGHELHGLPANLPRLLRAVSPFLEEVRSPSYRPQG